MVALKVLIKQKYELRYFTKSKREQRNCFHFCITTNDGKMRLPCTEENVLQREGLPGNQISLAQQV